MHSTIAHIHIDNFKKNIDYIRQIIGSDVMLCVPVKANAYGHGALLIAQEAQKHGVDYLGVATVQEGVFLRQSGITLPILCFSLTHPTELEYIVCNNLSPFVCDTDYICALQDCAKKHNIVVSVHLKVDTGMSRVGCAVGEAVKLAQLVSQCDSLQLAGICTHFAVADSRLSEDVTFTEKQISLFNDALESIRLAGIDTGLVHASNSGGTFYFPHAHYNMVRVGIASYGYLDTEQEKNLLPVMSLTSAVSSIKEVKKGQSISYGRTWIAEKDTDIATLPIGYGDGLLRRFSPGLKVCINGELYPIVGRICMDQCMIDLGKDHGVRRWDTVTIFGSSNSLHTISDKQEKVVSAQVLANQVNTISYEILTSVTERVPRVVE